MLHAHLEVTVSSQSTRFILAHHIKIRYIHDLLRKPKNMEFLLDVSASVKGFITCLSEQQHKYYFEQNLALAPSVHWPGWWPHSGFLCYHHKAGTGDWTQVSWAHPALSNIPPLAGFFLPHQADFLWATGKGQLHPISVWFAGAKLSPARPLAAHPCGWCIYRKSWSLQWFQLLPSALWRQSPSETDKAAMQEPWCLHT